MRKVTASLLALTLLVCAAGCASPYKQVMVVVVNAYTNAPVAGVSVTSNLSPQPDRQVVRELHIAITDNAGRVVLPAAYFRNESADYDGTPHPIAAAWYRIDIRNEIYDEHLEAQVSPEKAAELVNRPPRFIPTQPDLVVKIGASDSSIQLARRKLQRKRDEQQAQDWFEHTPDYWPKNRSEPGSFVDDNAGSLLLAKRWEAGSVNPLGSPQDVESIRKIVLEKMNARGGEVAGMRWLSPTLVMVAAGWSEGRLNAGSVTYVLKKTPEGWSIFADYLNWIT